MLFFVHRRRARRHLGASARCLWRKMHLRPHSLETLRSFRIFPPRCGYGCGCGCSVDVSVGVGVDVGERETDLTAESTCSGLRPGLVSLIE